MFLSRITFEEILGQAQALDNGYTVEEESANDLEAYRYEYEDRPVDVHASSAATNPPSVEQFPPKK